MEADARHETLESDADRALLRQEIGRRLAGALAEVRLAYLFGSRAVGRARPDSDIDVAVLVDDECVDDPAATNRTIRRVLGFIGGGDIRSERLDLVLLNHAPVLLRHRVLRDGHLLHARSEVERVRFAVRTMREYQDFAPWLDEHRRRRIARLKSGRRTEPRGGSGDILEAARRAGRLLGAR